MKRDAWRGYLLTVSASFLTLFLALFASVFSLVGPFSLTVSLPSLLRLCVLSALVSAGVYAAPRASLRAGLVVLLCGVMALYVWWRWDAVVYGAQFLFHQISYGFHQEIPAILYYELPRQLSQSYGRQAAVTFFTVAIPMLALWLGPWLTLRWAVWPAVGAVAALVGCPLLILRQPGTAPLCACLLFLALVLLSRQGYRASPSLGARRVLLSLVPVALTIALLGAVIPVDANPRPEWVEDLRLTLQRLPQTGISIGIGGESRSQPGQQSFRQAGPLRFDGHTVLQINSSASQNPLYLRGFSAGTYTHNGWQPLDSGIPYPLEGETGGRHPASWPFQAQADQNIFTVRITDLSSTTSYFYLPYYPAALPLSATFAQDAYLERPDGMDQYIITFQPQNATAVQPLADRTQAARDELVYRQWVYENYLDVPYDLLTDQAVELMESFADTVDLSQGPASVAQQLKDYLSSFTTYDQRTPLTPAGEDFVSYFLTQSHRGYCVHYASAAVLFFRTCGLPTRYAAGYVARPGRANMVTNVPDRNAHAWVEVYVDGFGWQPFDVTPGFSGGGNLSDPGGVDPTPTPSPSPSQAPPSAAPSPSPSPTPTPSQQPGQSEGNTFSLAPYLSFLGTALGVLAAVAALVLQRRLRLHLLRKRCCQANPNRAVISLYRYLTTLERRAGVACPPQALTLAQKAYFSQHTLSGDERAAMEALARAAAGQAETFSFLRKLLLKYVWALL